MEPSQLHRNTPVLIQAYPYSVASMGVAVRTPIAPWAVKELRFVIVGRIKLLLRVITVFPSMLITCGFV